MTVDKRMIVLGVAVLLAVSFAYGFCHGHAAEPSVISDKLDIEDRWFQSEAYEIVRLAQSKRKDNDTGLGRVNGDIFHIIDSGNVVGIYWDTSPLIGPSDKQAYVKKLAKLRPEMRKCTREDIEGYEIWCVFRALSGVHWDAIPKSGSK